jgi:hypothetical protein
MSIIITIIIIIIIITIIIIIVIIITIIIIVIVSLIRLPFLLSPTPLAFVIHLPPHLLPIYHNLPSYQLDQPSNVTP